MKSSFIILVSFSCFAQSVADPRLRVSVLPNLALSTTWQTINFNGFESLDINTFGIDPISGLKFLLIILLLKLSTTMVNMIVTFLLLFNLPLQLLC
jgi:hypothetical protein